MIQRPSWQCRAMVMLMSALAIIHALLPWFLWWIFILCWSPFQRLHKIVLLIIKRGRKGLVRKQCCVNNIMTNRGWCIVCRCGSFFKKCYIDLSVICGLQDWFAKNCHFEKPGHSIVIVKGRLSLYFHSPVFRRAGPPMRHFEVLFPQFAPPNE